MVELCRLSRARAVVLALAVGMVSLAPPASADGAGLDASDFRVRVQAALKLGKQGGASAREALERGLKDTHPAVRVACAVALGSIGESAAIPALQRATRAESTASVRATMAQQVDKLRARASSAARPAGSVAKARYVVQLGTMRNNTAVRAGGLDGVMRDVARRRAESIKGALVVDASDEATVKTAAARHVPVLLLDGNLTQLTQTSGKAGGVVVTARVSISVRSAPQHTLKGIVTGAASATDTARARNEPSAIAELQSRALAGAMESAVGSVGNAIDGFAK